VQEEYKKAAEENLVRTIKAGSFSLKDQITFYKRKWLKEHNAIMLFCGLCILGVFTAGIVFHKYWLISAAMAILFLGHCWRYNTMMAYIENHAFDGSGKQ